jgi:hypothetical protein
MDADSTASLSSSGTGKSTADQMANQRTPVPHPVRPPSPFVPSISKSRRFHLPLQSVTGITTGKMGQAQSTGPSKLKRAFGPRWKKSDESEKDEKDKNSDRSGDDHSSIPAQAQPQIPLSTSMTLSTSNPPPSSIARHIVRLAPRKLSMSSSVPPPTIQSTPDPSPAPPSLSPQLCTKPDPSADDNAPVIINSPGISAAVQFMRQQESTQTPARSDDPSSPFQHVEPVRRALRPNDSPTKDDWRKSDSTLASHITIRPGAGLPRTTRPASFAESAHSVNTIVPSSRRVSVIVPDSDLVEENDSDSDDEMEAVVTPVPPPQSASTPSLGLTNASRRQSSFFGSMTSFHPRIESEPESSPSHHSRSMSRGRLLGPSKVLSPIWTEANEHGVLSSGNEQPRSVGSGIRGRLAAWTSNNNRPSPPPSPTFEPNQSANPKLPGGFRQTTLSISGNLAPVAIDLGKRAMERIGRSWGSKSNPLSIQSSSKSDLTSNSGPPPSYKGKFSEYINRSHPGNSGSSHSITLSSSSKHKRRTPDGPSGTWSISSSQSSVSIDDKMSMQSGAASLNFGRIIRGPLSIGGGVVFGRPLADCVRDTAVDEVKQKLLSGEYYREEWEVDKIPPLQDRLLPALVLRCAQNLLAWGIQEEGLFRCAFGKIRALGIKHLPPLFQAQWKGVPRQSLACRV